MLIAVDRAPGTTCLVPFETGEEHTAVMASYALARLGRAEGHERLTAWAAAPGPQRDLAGRLLERLTES